MSGQPRRHEITLKPVLFELPRMGDVRVHRDVAYAAADGSRLTMDVYLPPDAAPGARPPAVVIVEGYPDSGAEALLGCKLKDMACYGCWARLIGASGLAAVAYTNREPAADLDALLAHLQRHGAELGIDARRLGVLAFSGNVPLALSFLMTKGREPVKSAVLVYGYTLDLDGATGVAEAAAQWGFANPAAGKSVADLPRDLPLLIVRAGKDETAKLNEGIDAFVASALALNRPLTLVNHSTGPHAFDLLDDSAATRDAVRTALSFLQTHLLR
jgi:dienelactone hydrolase